MRFLALINLVPDPATETRRWGTEFHLHSHVMNRSASILSEWLLPWGLAGMTIISSSLPFSQDWAQWWFATRLEFGPPHPRISVLVWALKLMIISWWPRWLTSVQPRWIFLGTGPPSFLLLQFTVSQGRSRPERVPLTVVKKHTSLPLLDIREKDFSEESRQPLETMSTSIPSSFSSNMTPCFADEVYFFWPSDTTFLHFFRLLDQVFPIYSVLRRAYSFGISGSKVVIHVMVAQDPDWYNTISFSSKWFSSWSFSSTATLLRVIRKVVPPSHLYLSRF